MEKQRKQENFMHIHLKVSQTATPNGVAADTVITGIDYKTVTGEQGPRVYLNNQLSDNIGTASSNAKVDFKHALITSDPSGTAVAHGLNPGDVVYIDNGTTGGLTPAPPDGTGRYC